MIKAEIVGHSLSPQEDELISVLCVTDTDTLKKILSEHKEFSVTHTDIEKVEFEDLVIQVAENPFIPIAWKKENEDIQGSEYITDDYKISLCEDNWLLARDYTMKLAKRLNNADKKWNTNIEGTEVTKQLCNRLLEPFIWNTVLITGNKSTWESFFDLNCPSYENNASILWKSKKSFCEENSYGKNLSNIEWLKRNKSITEIHMMALAESIYDAVNESTPLELEENTWHIPFEDKLSGHNLSLEQIIKCSTAMIFYASSTIAGTESFKPHEEWIKLHDKLISQYPLNSTAIEHCARVMSDEEYQSFYKGRCYSEITMEEELSNQGWCNNFKGFLQYKYFIENNLEF